MDKNFDDDLLEKYADSEGQKEQKSNSEFEEISSNSENGKPYMLSDIVEKEENVPKGKRKPLTKKKKAGIIILTIVLCVVVLAVAGTGIYVLNKLGMLGNGVTEKFEEPDIAEEDLADMEKMNDVANAASLKDLLKKWATNGGAKMSSKNVINILLLGLDTTKSGKGAARADVIMIASVNKKTQKITLSSILRDSYTYMNTGTKEIYTKVNEAYYYGGPTLVMETIENDYKIEIDGYVSVNFETFPKVIDSLGGVEIDITQKEANYLNSAFTDMGVSGVKSGTGVTVDGKTALSFSRIRAIDSDSERARRQRDVVNSLINKAKNSTAKQVDGLLDQLLPYVETDLSNSKIISLATQAVSSGWVKYEVTQIGMPGENQRYGGYVGDKWYWICDYPGAAVDLQKALYGATNITLPEKRTTAIDLLKGSMAETTAAPKATEPSTKVSEEGTSSVEETTRRKGIFDFGEDEEETSAGTTRETTGETESKRVTIPEITTEEGHSWWFENTAD